MSKNLPQSDSCHVAQIKGAVLKNVNELLTQYFP